MNGGIFNAPNALGLGAFQPLNCSTQNTTLVRSLQTHLKTEKGISGLRIDGVWGPCSASAFRNAYGRPVNVQDLERIAGRPCTSGVLFGGTTDFLLPMLGTCQDGSDSAKGPTGGSQATDCPTGYKWNSLLGTCVPDPLNVLPPDGGNQTQPAETDCPQGQVRVGGICMPDIGQIFTPKTDGGNQTQPAAQGCPEGQMGFPPFCVPNPMGKQPGQQTQPPAAQGCPEGQMGIPPFCVPNPFGQPSGGQPTEPGAWPLPFPTIPSCPAGQTFSLATLSCQGGGQPTGPATCPAGTHLNANGQCEAEKAPFIASMGGIGVAAGILVVAAGIWYFTKPKKKPDMLTEAEMDAIFSADGDDSGAAKAIANLFRRRR